MRASGTLVVAITLAACYDPSLGPCAVTCAVGDLCPGALTCESDGFCHPVGEGPTCMPDAATTPDAASGDVYVMLAGGSRHTCGIDGLGELSCWGLNTRSQVEPSSTPRTGTPTAVTGDGWERIDGGTNATCGIQQHQLWCWGANDSNQAGQPSSTLTVTQPTRIDPSGEADFLELSVSSRHGCAIRGFTEQRLYCWGSDEADQLGRGPGDDSGEELEEVEGGFNDWLLVSAGERHSCGVRQNGVAYCWGDGSHGELGTDDTGSYDVPTEVETTVTFRSIAAGRSFTCGISEDGYLFCWGDNSSRQLGIEGSPGAETPTQVGTTMGWTGIATLFRGACGILQGRVQCWGGGSAGAIGNGAWADEDEPTPVAGLMNVSDLAAGDYHACAIAGGVTSCWGLDGDGQLGTGTFATKYEPTQVDAAGWSAVAAGEVHTCGIDDGALYCWGQNDQLQLGTSGPAQSPTPLRIGSDVGWKAVGVGTRFGCALREATPDELWCWGDDTYEQLGNTTSVTGARAATQIDNPAGVSQWDLLVVGPHAACATSGASRWCWGEGAEGQLGNQGTSNVDEPTQVPAEALTWSHLTMGYHFGAGLAGTHLYTWGRGAEGQIGNASTAMQLSPVDLGLNGWSDVTAAFNGNHACAIGNGSVACWGDNGSGKLGDGTTDGRAVPTAIVDHPTLPQAYSTVRAGSTHTCATHSDGLYCWGDGTLSQLGDETLTPYTDDPRLITTTEIQFLTTGKGHSCGLTGANSPLYCWGDNVHGVIGDGTEAKASPVTVLPPPPDR